MSSWVSPILSHVPGSWRFLIFGGDDILALFVNKDNQSRCGESGSTSGNEPPGGELGARLDQIRRALGPNPPAEPRGRHLRPARADGIGRGASASP